MSQINLSGNTLARSLLREDLLRSESVRERAFDRISHGSAFDALDIIRSVEWLYYHKALVMLPEQVDSYYGVPPKTCDRVIRFFRSELEGDGLFDCNFQTSSQGEDALGVCWIGKPSLYFLLPPRAVLKMAFFLPATKIVNIVIDTCSKHLISLPVRNLAEPAKKTNHYRDREKRVVDKERSELITVAKQEGIAAYIHHFGYRHSGVAWKRLIVHHEKGGCFPPARNELNSIMSEF